MVACVLYTFLLFLISIKNESEAWQKMKNYTSFLINRHPFERLVSAYNDKFSAKSSFSWYKQYVGTVIAKTLAPLFMHEVPLITG